MKNFFTLIANAKKTILLVMLALPFVGGAQILLQQDFNVSTNVNDYIGTDANQFDFIGVSGATGASVYATNNRMSLQKTGAANAALVKSTNLATPAPDFLRIKFKLTSAFSSAFTGSTAVIYVGSDLFPGAAVTGELASNGSRFASVAIGYPSANTFNLRNVSVSPVVTSSDFTQNTMLDITWYLNNSGAPKTYTNPNGGTSTIADDVSDLWIGNNLVFAAMPAQTPTQTLSNFKVLVNNGSGAISFDDFEITTGWQALPVAINNFTAISQGNSNLLNWSSTTENNNKGFNVQKKSAVGEWENIGFVAGNNRPSTYSFVDEKPLSNSFYRLQQLDMDGAISYSKVVSVSKNIIQSITIAPNPASDKVLVSLNKLNATDNSLIIADVYDFMGRRVLTQNIKNTTFELDISALPKGSYILNVMVDGSVQNKAFVKQ